MILDSYLCFRLYNEVSNNVDNIVKEFFPIKQSEQVINPRNEQMECSRGSSVCEDENDTKKTCWLGKCVECHRDNQSVDPAKLKCNKETFQCENGHFLGFFLTRELAANHIYQDMEITDNKLGTIETRTIPLLYHNTR